MFYLPLRLEPEGCQQPSWLTLGNDVNLAPGQDCDLPVESFSPPRFINKGASISHGCIHLKSIMRDLFSILRIVLLLKSNKTAAYEIQQECSYQHNHLFRQCASVFPTLQSFICVPAHRSVEHAPL